MAEMSRKIAGWFNRLFVGRKWLKLAEMCPALFVVKIQEKLMCACLKCLGVFFLHCSKIKNEMKYQNKLWNVSSFFLPIALPTRNENEIEIVFKIIYELKNEIWSWNCFVWFCFLLTPIVYPVVCWSLKWFCLL